MGLNTLRCHVKDSRPALFRSRRPARPHRLARYALSAVPRARDARGAAARRSASAVANHGHHPSVCVWTLFNEGWGIDLDDNPDDRRWLIETFDDGEGAGSGQSGHRQLALLPAQLSPQDRHRGLPLVQRLPASERRLRRDDARFRRARALGLVAAWRREARGDEPLICSEFGVWGLPHPSDILDAGRRRAVVVRERPRLESRRRLSARHRDALSRRRPRADFRRSRRLRRRGAGAAVPRAQISDRDAALGAGDLRLCDHRAQRRAVGIERPDGRAQPPARFRRAAR